jgi:hypothetical protein
MMVIRTSQVYVMLGPCIGVSTNTALDVVSAVLSAFDDRGTLVA